jgi:putative PIN family toxin of toxin-antitoxin system
MNVVLDTNILLSALPKQSKYHYIIDQLLSGTYKLLISTEIYFEYMEVLGLRGSAMATFFLESAILKDENVEVVEIHFGWNLIVSDEDDNKFVDCAIAGNADYLVTAGKHFDLLKGIPFPTVVTIHPDDFLKILENE